MQGDEDLIPLTFTRVEWKLIAIALNNFDPNKVKGGQFMTPITTRLAQKVANRVGA